MDLVEKAKRLAPQFAEAVPGQNFARVTELGECDTATRDARVAD